MNSVQMVLKAIENSGRQIEKAYEGLSEAEYDKKLCDSAMTPREILEHFCECYHNAVPYADGIEPKWGAFSIEDKSAANLWKVFAETRQRAVQKAQTLEGEKLFEIGMGFLAMHDAYHVGQLCQLRVHLDPSWNAYSIYE